MSVERSVNHWQADLHHKGCPKVGAPHSSSNSVRPPKVSTATLYLKFPNCDDAPERAMEWLSAKILVLQEQDEVLILVNLASGDDQHSHYC
jgi:hypothetical protein